MSNILGGNSSQNTQSSSQTGIQNLAFPGLSQALAPTVNSGAGASSLLSQLLGGGAGGSQAYNQYQGSTGFQNQLNVGTKAITNNAATAGLLNSGATLKALDQYGTGLAQQNFSSYLQNLLGLGQLGNQAGNVIGSTGGVTNVNSQSSGSSNSKTGLGL